MIPFFFFSLSMSYSNCQIVLQLKCTTALSFSIMKYSELLLIFPFYLCHSIPFFLFPFLYRLFHVYSGSLHSIQSVSSFQCCTLWLADLLQQGSWWLACFGHLAFCVTFGCLPASIAVLPPPDWNISNCMGPSAGMTCVFSHRPGVSCPRIVCISIQLGVANQSFSSYLLSVVQSRCAVV